jgi:hypothetical protein
MTIATDGFGSIFNGVGDEVEAGTFELPDGFFLNVLPTQSDRGTIATLAGHTTTITLSAATWYSITVEVLVKNAVTPARYVYRNQVEAYRDGAGAILHLNPEPSVEEPPGGSYSVEISALGNDVTVQIVNDSPNTVSFARYIGYSRKAIP